MRKGSAIGIGLLIAFVGHFLGLALAGAGHGWNTALWVSPIFWIAYPATLIRAADSTVSARGSRLGDLAWLLVAAACDVLLVFLTYQEGVEYFWKIVEFDGWWIVGLWIAIWFGWQIVAVVNAVRRRLV